MRPLAILVIVTACGGNSSSTPDAGLDPTVDAAADARGSSRLGTATASDVTCPGNVPAGSTCKHVIVTGCPGIEGEALGATVAVLAPTNPSIGTILHFSGGGGTGFHMAGQAPYRAANYLQAFVAWDSDWEVTAAAGLKTAACRPATVMRWAFDEPALHAASRAEAFCGEGFSGGSGQLAYSLAHYGLGDYFDYVNELSGPPFARIDLGCDGNAPATATVCGDSVTMKLPVTNLNTWENITTPSTCGGTANAAAEVQRWHDDSVVSTGAIYDYPKTRVEFFTCTNNATAVTGMAQLYFAEIMTAGASRTAAHCYHAADGCAGENLGATGGQDAVDAMLAGCTPRH